MPKEKSAPFDESSLTKGQLRKLTALRKSVGESIADRAFAEWLATQPAAPSATSDPSAEAIATAIWRLIEKNEVKIPRGGYLVRRGRGRVVVEPLREN